MEIIKPSVTLEAISIPAFLQDNVLKTNAVDNNGIIKNNEIAKVIEKAGRTCYKSEKNITEDSCIKFCEMIQTLNHRSVTEHCSATFRIITSRDILQEIVRHRIASYSVESSRYCNYSPNKKGMQFIMPYWINEEDVKNWDSSTTVDVLNKGSLEFILTCKVAEQRYNTLIEEGFKPQEARSILPGCLKTEIVMTANFREWLHFLELRTSRAAHPDMQIIAKMIADILNKICPIIFKKIN